MTHCSTLNEKLSNSQLNEPKSGIKNRTKVTLNLLPNMIGKSNDNTNFLNKLLLFNTQVPRFCKDVAHGSSAYIKLSKLNCPNRAITRIFRQTLRTFTKNWFVFNEKCA